MPPRPRYPMPDFIRDALNARGVMDAYRARPSYQRNDYIGSPASRARNSSQRSKSG